MINDYMDQFVNDPLIAGTQYILKSLINGLLPLFTII